MATKAERKEWTDYFAAMEEAIESGAMDDIILDLDTLVTARVQYLSNVDAGVKTKPVSTYTTPITIDGKQYEKVEHMLGQDNRVPGGFSTRGNNGHGVLSPRWYYLADITGKVVTIKHSVKPKYLAGMTLLVLSHSQKNFKVQMLDGPSGRRFSKGDVFGCPPSLFDVEWK